MFIRIDWLHLSGFLDGESLFVSLKTIQLNYCYTIVVIFTNLESIFIMNLNDFVRIS